MSKQRQKVAEIIQEVSRFTTNAALILGGSVRHGRERPDSDLDFFGISDAALEHSLRDFKVISVKNGSKLLESLGVHGFPIHIAYWSRQSLEVLLQQKPYMTYPILDGELVYDPGNIAAPYIEQMRQYFGKRPKLKQAWNWQLEALRDFKTGKPQTLLFPQWSDFLRHIEDTGLDKETESTASP